MKKTLLVVFILLFVSLLCAVVDIPVEKIVFAYEGDPANARAFYSEPAGGACNKKVWEFPVTVEAQIAQWVQWSIDGTKWTWFVRKPGKYFADCIGFAIKSNSDVGFTFSGFSNLTYASTGTSVNPVIPVWYNWGSDAILVDGYKPEGNEWIPAEALNGLEGIIKDSQKLHDGWKTKLWNMIEVVECNSASTYRATGIVTITLKNQKPWIIPETGDYDESEFFPKPIP
jgi:hypothetical protein